MWFPACRGKWITLIKRAMAKDKNKRYSTAVELAKALNLVAFGNEGNFTSATNTGLRPTVYSAAGQLIPWKNRDWSLAVIILAVAAVGVFLLRNQLFAAPQVEPTLTSLHQPSIPTETPTATLEPPPLSCDRGPFRRTFCASLRRRGDDPHSRCQGNEQGMCQESPVYSSFPFPKARTFESLSPDCHVLKNRQAMGRPSFPARVNNSFHIISKYVCRLSSPVRTPANATRARPSTQPISVASSRRRMARLHHLQGGLASLSITNWALSRPTFRRAILQMRFDYALIVPMHFREREVVFTKRG